MDRRQFFKLRLYITGIITIAIWIILAWDYNHGGVPGHHILADETLPKISNWWGGLLLPLLTLFLLYRIQIRSTTTNGGNTETPTYSKNILYRFAVALLFGIILSVFFSFGNTDVPGYMILAVLPLSFFVPIYLSECLLGFVVGMTFTFGGVLPTGIGSILLLMFALIHLLIRPAILYGASKVGRVLSSNNNTP